MCVMTVFIMPIVIYLFVSACLFVCVRFVTPGYDFVCMFYKGVCTHIAQPQSSKLFIPLSKKGCKQIQVNYLDKNR